MIRISDLFAKFGGAIQQSEPRPEDARIQIDPHATLWIPQRNPIAISITPNPGATLAQAARANDSFQCWNSISRTNQALQTTYFVVLGAGLWEVDIFVSAFNNATAADNTTVSVDMELFDVPSGIPQNSNIIFHQVGGTFAHQNHMQYKMHICSQNNIAFALNVAAAAVGATAIADLVIQGHRLL